MATLEMIKLNMTDIPEANLPEGFILRAIKPEDAPQWETLCTVAFNSDHNFVDIKNRQGYIEDGAFVIIDVNASNNEEKIVATGMISKRSKNGEDYGYLEYIAACPEYSGKRLGYEVTTALLRKLCDMGIKKAYLCTWESCLPAINIYLKLGFAPDMSVDESMPVRWENIYVALQNNKYHENELKKLLTKAEQGDVDAQFELFRHFQDVDNGEQIIYWLTKAAEQGHAEAQYALGFYYKDGEFVEQDNEKYIQWQQKSAMQGYAEAQFNIAWCHAEGKGVEKNLPQAMVWFEKCAMQDRPDAQHHLAYYYWRGGDGVKQDYAKALEWYTKLAKHDGANSDYEWEIKRARNALGLMYYCGYGTTRDYKAAIKWYTAAADMGDAGARKFLDFFKQANIH
ncbi:MAG: GNAT family N-acetyltransferase [Defluviitaleaceae bacterium]|nr:GNAT family N-acetyltransferase [Defluviitaleaceae bacterium]